LRSRLETERGVCKRCEEIDASIARYRRVLADVKDEAVIIIVKAFVSDLESEKGGLHPVDK
jgi:hypothetical protein